MIARLSATKNVINRASVNRQFNLEREKLAGELRLREIWVDKNNNTKFSHPSRTRFVPVRTQKDKNRLWKMVLEDTSGSKVGNFRFRVLGDRKDFVFSKGVR